MQDERRRFRVLVLGSGGVGTVSAKGLARLPEVERIGLADLSLARAQASAAEVNDPRVVPLALDASDTAAVRHVLADYGMVIHAGLPRHNLAVMQACLEAGSHYLDMASDGPVDLPGAVTIQAQMRWDDRLRAAGLTAVLGIGVDPGLTNLFARWAADRLERIEEVVVYDGDNSTLDGVPFGLAFSPETSIEECLQPPLTYRDGVFETGVPLVTGVEVFDFPEPLGRMTVRSVAHEEVGTLPLFLASKGLRRCEFKYALSEEYVNVLKVLHLLGLHRAEPIEVEPGVKAVPVKVVAALLPTPKELTPSLNGTSCVGTWVKGVDREGRETTLYIYTLSSHAQSRQDMNANVTVWQAGIPPVIAAQMLMDGTIAQRGALVPEQLDPEPWLERLPRWGMPVYVRETVHRPLALAAPRG
jgi:saccharopine dehydrogenase (NAD+, L-lysine-forming)